MVLIESDSTYTQGTGDEEPLDTMKRPVLPGRGGESTWAHPGRISGIFPWMKPCVEIPEGRASEIEGHSNQRKQTAQNVFGI